MTALELTLSKILITDQYRAERGTPPSGSVLAPFATKARKNFSFRISGRTKTFLIKESIFAGFALR